jgi:hypothetical protein
VIVSCHYALARSKCVGEHFHKACYMSSRNIKTQWIELQPRRTHLQGMSPKPSAKIQNPSLLA